MVEILNQDLPKQDPKIIVKELQQALVDDSISNKQILNLSQFIAFIMIRFFPQEERERFIKNFSLFTKGSNYANLEQLKNILISVEKIYPDEELEELYQALIEEKEQQNVPGVQFQDFLVIVYKKLREQDKEQQLLDAFKNFDTDGSGLIESETFKEFLMTKGNRMSEDMAEDFMKNCDPKGEGKFSYEDFVRKLMK